MATAIATPRRMAALVSLMAFVLPCAAPAWANQGGGDGRDGLRIEYWADDDSEADEVLTAEPEERPLGFTDSIYFTPHFGGFSLGGRYQPAPVDETEPNDFTVDYGDWDAKLSYRIKYRFPTLVGDGDEPAQADASWSTTPGLSLRASIKLDSQVWLAPEPEEDIPAVDERAASIWTSDFPRIDIPPEQIRQFQQWLEENMARGAARGWLGDETYEKLQAEFGPQTDLSAAADQSNWPSIYLYCGGTCVVVGE